MDDENKRDQPKVQADHNAIAVGGVHIDGDVSGNIQIGHTTGYTADEVSVLITQIKSTFQPRPFDGRCPYKGLDVFEEEDAELFFGREKLVDDLIIRVKDSKTLFVTGPSGSGKSSLVRAGLIHALKQGAIKNSERWLYETMKPGRDPIGELGRVASSLAGSTNAEDEIRAKAMGDATIFARWCEIALKEGRDKRVVLFIDQFEEVFTQISKEEERVAFLNLLTHAATVENGRVIILFSMRSDFVSNCATYPQLNALLNQQFVQIGAMQPDELVSAIAQPALRVGLRIDPDLIAQIINDMKGEPGALPLMQFALKDLFDSQQSKDGVIALTLNDYLQRGGIRKSLERHADDVFGKLSESERGLARSIFSGLIEIGRGTQDTRRTALFDELVPTNAKAEDVEAIIQKLADARLITTDEQAGKDTVTISHEKLIDAWPWLKKLVNENRDTIALKNEIVSDAKEWGNQKRDTSYLYTGARLANAREHLDAKKLVLSGLAQEFVLAAFAKQRRGQLALVSGVLTIVALSIAAVIVFSQQATINAETASTAQAANTFAVAQQATAQSASTQAVAQEVIARANAEESQKQTYIALARQLASQAQSTNSVLLAMQSLNIFPTSEAAQVLLNSGLGAFENVRVITHDGDVTSFAFSPDAFSPDGRDRTYVVSGSDDNTARMWETEEIFTVELARMTHDGDVTSVAFSPDGNYVVSGSLDFTARVWEAGTGVEVARMTHNNGVTSVAFSPDGKYVASGSDDGTIRVWEATTGVEVAHIAHDSNVTSVAFSPDGKYVVSGSFNSAGMWVATTGVEVARMAYGSFVISVAFSPDGKYVVSGSNDNTARVWDAFTGEEVARMTHDGGVFSVAFSPDGKYVVSGSWDNTARVWDAFTGEEVARMTHGGRVNYVAFSPDGKYVVSAGCDENDGDGCTKGATRLWLWQPDDLIANVCEDSYWIGMHNLTRAEWKQYIGDALPYQAVCPNWPIEPEPTSTAIP